jgi:DNA polymerase-3 subunit epsilon
VRIVNGRILREEAFEQLIDPQRPLSPESIAIHGIEPQMLVGQPTAAVVLPLFHRYAEGTVLVAHNAAFDMRFLELKEAALGIRFDQPVLDTLLLAYTLFPNQESNRFEALAERFGVRIIGRHTALGDALVTAELFLKMVPLLMERGIRTLGQAREAAQQTYLAKLRY